MLRAGHSDDGMMERSDVRTGGPRNVPSILFLWLWNWSFWRRPDGSLCKGTRLSHQMWLLYSGTPPIALARTVMDSPGQIWMPGQKRFNESCFMIFFAAKC